MNYGKDFTRDTVEIVARGPPGGYAFVNAVDYDFALRGALTFITEQNVSRKNGKSIICEYFFCFKH